MTDTMSNAQTETDTGAALAGASAVTRCLPAADLTPGAPSGIEAAIPAPGSKAVAANLVGAVGGQLIIVLSPELAAQVENGPIGPQELVAGLEPAFTDATSALASMLGDLRFEAAQALDADVAVASASTYESIVVVPLTAGGTAVASLVLLLNHGVPEGAGVEAAGAASFEPLSGSGADGAVRAVELLNDVEMGVTAELGRTRMTVRELLSMQPGSIVELDRAAGSPVDLLVNGTLVARGEVVVIDEEFGVRITEIIGYDQKKAQ